jgi:hypothetical protein
VLASCDELPGGGWSTGLPGTLLCGGKQIHLPEGCPPSSSLPGTKANKIFILPLVASEEILWRLYLVSCSSISSMQRWNCRSRSMCERLCWLPSVLPASCALNSFTRARSPLQYRFNEGKFVTLTQCNGVLQERTGPAMSVPSLSTSLAVLRPLAFDSFCAHNYEKPTPPGAPAPIRASSNVCTKHGEGTRSNRKRQRNTIMRPSIQKNSRW